MSAPHPRAKLPAAVYFVEVVTTYPEREFVDTIRAPFDYDEDSARLLAEDLRSPAHPSATDHRVRIFRGVLSWEEVPL